MPQSVFDSLVIVDLMTGLASAEQADSILSKLIQEYLYHYPSEQVGQLKADIYTASHQVAPLLDQVHNLYSDPDDPKRRTHVYAFLKLIQEAIVKLDRANKPILRRFFGGALFNYESSPQLNRVQNSQANIASATMSILAKQTIDERRDAAQFDVDAAVRKFMDQYQ